MYNIQAIGKNIKPMTDFDTEFEILSSIFCNPGELTRISDTYWSLQMGSGTELYIDHVHVLNVRLRAVHLDRQTIAQLQANINELVKDIIQGHIPLSQLCLQAKDMTLQHISAETASDLNPAPELLPESDTIERHIYSIDHIRNRTVYSSKLKQICQETSARAQLLIQAKILRLALEGKSKELNIFVRKWKTVSVDVDSKGKPCKEKLMKFMESKKIEEYRLEPGLTVTEFDNFKELEEYVRKELLLRV